MAAESHEVEAVLGFWTACTNRNPWENLQVGASVSRGMFEQVLRSVYGGCYS